MLSQPLLASFLPLLLLILGRCRTSLCQYSSDQCSWKGSGLTHEGHTRDVEQVYLRCSQGSLEWLYPTGAIIVNLRPNTISPAAARLSVCVKPAPESSGTNVYLDLNGRLRSLLREHDQAAGRVRCFGILEGALFIEAIPRTDISRRVTAFQYELVSDELMGDRSLPAEACQPCNEAEVLLAVCTKDFVARGIVTSVREETEENRSSINVDINRLYRQKTQVFVPGGPRARRWSGSITMPRQCAFKVSNDDILFTGTLRFGEARMGCATRYDDFLHWYRQAQRLGTNPCHLDTD
ncbi:meteorin-like protein [Corythoichthys intestinalis]|uniref:meteorin-like protein n=1 Tax=Corythoichthys intestinalis TaxID=161448 RepID=UPI0025A59270|nr:meteorin-like protein [Corythoichthys intestinalis]XP_061805459.1 meteorin-like protein [Nerophis lumbriciformis]